MKIIVLLLSLLISFSVLASARVELSFPVEKIKQGSIQSATARISTQNAQGLELQKLKGQTLGEVLYLYSVSPLLRKEGSQDFEAEVSVIFVKVPQANTLTQKTLYGELEVFWDNIEVVPTEAPQELLFGTFEIPSRVRIFKIIIILLGVLFVVGGLWKLQKFLKEKKAIKLRKEKIRDEILGAREYEDVVTLWQKKHQYFQEFPHIEDAFHKLETTLNKYQFKRSQAETEKIEVMNAYRKFIEEVKGGFNGI